MILAAAGDEIAVVPGEAEARFAMFEEEAFDGDGIRVVPLQELLHGRMGAYCVHEGMVLQVAHPARAAPDRPRHVLDLGRDLGLVVERIELLR
jgi:hypothetical protein